MKSSSGRSETDKVNKRALLQQKTSQTGQRMISFLQNSIQTQSSLLQRSAISEKVRLHAAEGDIERRLVKRALTTLHSEGRRLGSATLSTLAIKAAADPFKKVKKLIKDLITKLLEEANEEATHKGWCDVELETNKQTRNEKSELVITLHAEIDELSASITKLGEEITELTQAVAEIDAAVAKATAIREAEKAKNTETIADSQEAQTAVSQALTVLREFYDKAAQATAMVQQQPEAPEIFDEPY
jgi:chromosome segregation ATPase